MKQFDFSTDFYNIGSGFIDFSIRFRMEHTGKRGSTMKTLIVYYSLEGNTDYAAGKIREITGGELAAEAIFIDPKQQHNEETDRDIEAFAGRISDGN
ncbi:MAG: hypothetical protein ACI4KK_02190 [Lentihominibacter sp.]